MSRATPDEWTFVLLGRDVAAPQTIAFWAAERVRLGKNELSDPQIAEALAVVDAMRREQETAGLVNDVGYDELLAIARKAQAGEDLDARERWLLAENGFGPDGRKGAAAIVDERTGAIQ